MAEELSAIEHVAAIIEAADPGTFVTKYIVLAEAIDSEGNRAFYWSVSDDIKKYDTMGMLEYAKTIEMGRVIRDD